MNPELTTLTGLTAAVTAMTAALKPLIGTTGRGTHLLALIIAATLTVATAWQTGAVYGPGGWVAIIMNSILSAAAAVGIHQGTVGIKEVEK